MKGLSHPLNVLMFPSSTCLHTSSIIHPRHPPPHEILPLQAPSCPLPTTLPFHTPPVSDHCQSSHQSDCINVCCPLLASAQHNTVLLPAPFLSKNTLPKRSPEWHLHAGAWTTRALSPKQSSPCYRKVLPALRWTRKSLLWNLTLLPISVSIQSGLTTWKRVWFLAWLDVYSQLCGFLHLVQPSLFISFQSCVDCKSPALALHCIKSDSVCIAQVRWAKEIWLWHSLDCIIVLL